MIYVKDPADNLVKPVNSGTALAPGILCSNVMFANGEHITIPTSGNIVFSSSALPTNRFMRLTVITCLDADPAGAQQAPIVAISRNSGGLPVLFEKIEQMWGGGSLYGSFHSPIFWNRDPLLYLVMRADYAPAPINAILYYSASIFETVEVNV